MFVVVNKKFGFAQMPEGCSVPDYHTSGWCCFESCVSNICKPAYGRLTLSDGVAEKDFDVFAGGWVRFMWACDNGRPVPIVPETFNTMLDKRNFTTKADKDVVKGQFRDTFNAASTAEELDCDTE